MSSVTTLPFGLTVVTENASLTSTVALTFPTAGSSNEGPAEAGAAIANRYLSFKSGSGLSSALVIRNLEDVGAFLFSSAGAPMKSYLGCDSGKHGEEGVTAEINKCAECDSREA